MTGVPAWVDPRRLLSEDPWEAKDGIWTATLSREGAADVSARLRGLVLAGRALQVEVSPRLKRALVRKARTEDARRRRAASVGFSHPGAQLDDEGRVSLTPEALALELGERFAGLRVVDATCGCGGNTIGFARAGCSVIAIDTSAERVAMARHNAALYGVSDRVEFHVSTAESLLPGLAADRVFIDPPWTNLGGLPAIVAAARAPVTIKVPPDFDPALLPGTVPEAVFGVAPGDRQRIKFLLLHPS